MLQDIREDLTTLAVQSQNMIIHRFRHVHQLYVDAVIPFNGQAQLSALVGASVVTVLVLVHHEKGKILVRHYNAI